MGHICCVHCKSGSRLFFPEAGTIEAIFGLSQEMNQKRSRKKQNQDGVLREYELTRHMYQLENYFDIHKNKLGMVQ